MTRRTTLRVIKAVHTVIWAFFALTICAIWSVAARANFVGAVLAIAIVLIEVAILGLNHGRCPLGGVVERYTVDRAANFDISLPAWLAARTKPIFGTLYAASIVFSAFRWATVTAMAVR